MSQTPRTAKGYQLRLPQLHAKIERTRAPLAAARLLLEARRAAPTARGVKARERQARQRTATVERIGDLIAIEAALLEALVQMQRGYTDALRREARENPDTGPPPVAA